MEKERMPAPEGPQKREHREKRRRGGRLRGAGLALAAALAVLLFGGAGFGIGRGIAGFSARSASAATARDDVPAQSAKAQESAAEDGDNAAGETRLTVRVKDESIYYMGVSVTPQQLREKLLADFDADSGERIALEDDGAIKAAYDEACGVLDELGIPYDEISSD